jgi:hypothetical protein
MSVFDLCRPCACFLLFVSLLAAGCDEGEPDGGKSRKDGTPGAGKVVAGKRVPVGDNVDLEIFTRPPSRRVLIYAEVCLREGPLEQLLTRKNRKEHEAVLAADIDARKAHEALILAGAKEGKPVKWLPKYVPPTGTTIKVSLQYKDKKGKQVVLDARSWIRNLKTRKELTTDWVFPGSMLVDNPLDKNARKHYLANDGDVICISNFESAMLDLPIESSKADLDRGYEAWTERIPPIGTKVLVILEPVLAEKKAK